MRKKTITLFCALLFLGLGLSAQSNVNIALSGTQSASYTAAWNNLKAVNDGVIGYGSVGGGTPVLANNETWASWSQNRPATQWLAYSWDEEYIINKASIYFWCDNMAEAAGTGVALPASWKIQYWDYQLNDWIDVILLNENLYTRNISEPNVVEFEDVTTSKIRIFMDASTDGILYAALGITEFEVYSLVEEPIIFVSQNVLFLDDSATPFATITVKGVNIPESGIDLAIDLPGVVLSTQKITQEEAHSETGAAVAVFYEHNDEVVYDAYLDLVCGNTLKQVLVVVSKDMNCFTPHPNNLVLDSRFLTMGNLSTWGTAPAIFSVLDNVAPYCGATCVRLSGAESGLEMRQNINFLPGTYKTSGYVKSNGTLQVGAYGIAGNFSTDSLEGVIDNNMSDYINFRISTTYGSWEYFEFSFQVENEVKGGAFINNGAGSDASEAFLDNWQFYLVEATTGVAKLVVEPITIMSVKGGLILHSDKKINANIYSIAGQLIKSVENVTGEYFIPLDRGMYFINGKKTIVY